MLAGCRGRDRLIDESVITETLEYVIPNTDGGVGAALIRTTTGETTVVYGEVTRESDGTSVKVEGPVVKSPDGTTTVIDTKTGTSYILEENTSTVATTTNTTTTRPSEPTKVTSVSEETTTTPTTTVKEPKPTTVATTTVKETTAKPTTQATTTVAPTTAPTTVAPAPTPTPTPIAVDVFPAWTPDYTPQEFKDEMFRLINEARVAFGVNALERGPDIIWQGADIRAREIAVKFSHIRPDGTTPGAAYIELGCTGDYLYYNLGMENIAFSSYDNMDAKAIFDQFMNSPGHRATILSQKIGQSPEYGFSKTMTIGYYYGPREEVNSAYKAVFAVVNIC